ncbi:PREDICTED: ubiquinol-cytochrome-c reductase complex assembly factor 1-like [Priapulus caudatus]|uniref:Ubiquinol-cytochrome-c reductase complex assembly factor 1-like n=1 Tax=Priapulus caudatus TaxID=37621 RepID=A0ABM1F2C9_PRICU|nr:PREDICTED: ubiquinol-cytochrome-c reductase complex assembly factor 1-like [Priapulus caudatus]
MSNYGSHSLGSELNTGFFTKVLDKLGYQIGMKYGKSRLRIAGSKMYELCVTPIDHLYFFKACGLPDTYNSWFVITELHVWMCMVRLMREDREGRFTRNILVQMMWDDVDKRCKQLGNLGSDRTMYIQELHEHFQASLFGYDEGILGNDMVLAAAIWRHFYAMKLDDPIKLNLLVGYIRRNVHNLDNVQSEKLLRKGDVAWLPLEEGVKTPDYMSKRERKIV